MHLTNILATNVERAIASSFELSLDRIGAFGLDQWGFRKRNLIIYLVAQGVLNTTLTLGMLVAIQYIIGQLNMQINQLTEFLKSMQMFANHCKCLEIIKIFAIVLKF